MKLPSQSSSAPFSVAESTLLPVGRRERRPCACSGDFRVKGGWWWEWWWWFATATRSFGEEDNTPPTRRRRLRLTTTAPLFSLSLGVWARAARRCAALRRRPHSRVRSRERTRAARREHTHTHTHTPRPTDRSSSTPPPPAHRPTDLAVGQLREAHDVRELDLAELADVALELEAWREGGREMAHFFTGCPL